MRTKTFIFIASAVLLAACAGSARRDERTAGQADAATAARQTDRYEGTFPAADCPGIEIALDLHGDGTYTMRSHYIDRDTFLTEGKYRRDGDLLVLTPRGSDETEYYRVGPGTLTRLDADGKPVEGPLADQYVLTKKR